MRFRVNARQGLQSSIAIWYHIGIQEALFVHNKSNNEGSLQAFAKLQARDLQFAVNGHEISELRRTSSRIAISPAISSSSLSQTSSRPRNHPDRAPCWRPRHTTMAQRLATSSQLPIFAVRWQPICTMTDTHPPSGHQKLTSKSI